MIDFTPSTIFIENKVKNNPFTKHILTLFPRTPHTTISKASSPRLPMYPSTLILAHNQGRSIVPCPGTPHYVCCNYYIIDIGIGCSYNCSYCFLNQYQQNPGITLYVNIDHMLKNITKMIKEHNLPFKRIGTGEFTDSLILDHITGYSKKLVPYFSKQNELILELKTKGTNIANLIKLKHNQRTVVSWSLNPEEIIKKDEAGSASLKQRLNAAHICQKAGYPIAFHFDPILYGPRWEDQYKHVVDAITNTLDPNRIVWISLGTLRFNPHMKQIMQQRYPKSTIIYEEMIKGLDGKLRYIQPVRIEIYKKMHAWLKKICPKTPVYLCMESPVVWKRSLGFAPKNPLELESYITKKWGQV